MPVLRSREILPKTPLKKTLANPNPNPNPPSLEPTTPARTDAPHAPLTSPTDQGSAPPRRRSLRLASMSNSSSDSVVEIAVPEKPSSTEKKYGKRKRVARVSGSPAEEKDEKSEGIEEGGTRVSCSVEEMEASDIALPPTLNSSPDESVDLTLSLNSFGETGAEDRVLNLRSGPKRMLVTSQHGPEQPEYRVLNLWKGTRDWHRTVEMIEDRFEKRYSYEEKGKKKVVIDVDSSEEDSDEVVLDVGGDEKEEGETQAHNVQKIRYSEVEKGKGKLVIEEDWLSIGRPEFKLDVDPIVVEEFEEPIWNDELVEHIYRKRKREPRRTVKLDVEDPIVVEGFEERQLRYRKEGRESRRTEERNRAIRSAPDFAFFKRKEEEEEDDEEEETQTPLGEQEKEDWPGPFSTAMKIIEEREAKLRARELKSASKETVSIEDRLQWIPSKDRRCRLVRSAPPLKDLCMNILSENAEEIESLEGIPDSLKHELISLLCNSRKMSSRVLGLLVNGTTTEIRLSECSWATEEQFEGVFSGCNTNNLTVLQLDLCGRCMPDYVLCATLARSPNSLPSLTTVSLKGAYRLSDHGLNALASSAPSLSSINLSLCSLLTSEGIIGLAEKLNSVLRELYIDDCHEVDALLILPALKKLKYLEVLSVTRIESVCNKFVHDLISVCGPNMKKLVFTGCGKLSTTSMKTIGEKCSQLCVLDLQDLHRLNDSALKYLANGCRSIKKLRLHRNVFSDEAIAAFLEASGASLTELSLNHVRKVSQLTALAIARRCSLTLQHLNLSFCRNITDKAVGLIVDSCSCLRTLQMFGCTQITTVFLDGHSNSLVNIAGPKEGLILEHLKRPDFM